MLLTNHLRFLIHKNIYIYIYIHISALLCVNAQVRSGYRSLFLTRLEEATLLLLYISNKVEIIELNKVEISGFSSILLYIKALVRSGHGALFLTRLFTLKPKYKYQLKKTFTLLAPFSKVNSGRYG